MRIISPRNHRDPVKIFRFPLACIQPSLRLLNDPLCLGRAVCLYVERTANRRSQCWLNTARQGASNAKCMRVTWKLHLCGAEEPGGLQSVGSQRVRHDWATSLSLFTFMHWRRKWQPTPVLLPGESQGQRSLVGCCLWGCTESDRTERLSISL